MRMEFPDLMHWVYFPCLEHSTLDPLGVLSHDTSQESPSYDTTFLLLDASSGWATRLFLYLVPILFDLEPVPGLKILYQVAHKRCQIVLWLPISQDKVQRPKEFHY